MSLISKPSRAILIGGALFAFPLLLLIVLINKAIQLLLPFARKLVDVLGIHSLFGAATITITCVVVIVLICFISGILLEKGFLRSWSVTVEEKLFLFFPGFQVIKFELMAENKPEKHHWQPILLQENSSYRVAFITDQQISGFFCVYLPDAPKIDAGEVLYIRKEDCHYVPITMRQAIRSLHRFGRGFPIDQALTPDKAKPPG